MTLNLTDNKDYHKNYYEKHSGVIRERTAQWVKDNRDRHNQANLMSYHRNKDEINRKRRERYKHKQEQMQMIICA